MCVCACACMRVLVFGRIYPPPLFQAVKWPTITYKAWLRTGYVAMVFSFNNNSSLIYIYICAHTNISKKEILIDNKHILALFFSFKSHFFEHTFFFSRIRLGFVFLNGHNSHFVKTDL